MTASIATELVQDVRALILAITDATDDKVIVASDSGPRPPKPYLTVKTTTIGQARGPAERVNGVTEDEASPEDWSLAVPNSKMRERRKAVASIQGYGSGAAVWLDQLQIGIDSPLSLAVQAEHAISATVLSPVTDLSAILDTGNEPRFGFELALGYLYESETADHVPLERIEVHSELRRFPDDPDTLAADQVAVEPDQD